MPHVVVKMYPEREEVKTKLAEEITRLLTIVADKPEAAISVDIQEITESEWMSTVYNEEIRPRIDQLYKKPGY